MSQTTPFSTSPSTSPSTSLSANYFTNYSVQLPRLNETYATILAVTFSPIDLSASDFDFWLLVVHSLLNEGYEYQEKSKVFYKKFLKAYEITCEIIYIKELGYRINFVVTIKDLDIINDVSIITKQDFPTEFNLQDYQTTILEIGDYIQDHKSKSDENFIRTSKDSF